MQCQKCHVNFIYILFYYGSIFKIDKIYVKSKSFETILTMKNENVDSISFDLSTHTTWFMKFFNKALTDFRKKLIRTSKKGLL